MFALIGFMRRYHTNCAGTNEIVSFSHLTLDTARLPRSVVRENERCGHNSVTNWRASLMCEHR